MPAEATDRHGTKWYLVAREVPTRTDIQCRERYYAIKHATPQTAVDWSDEAVDALQDLVGAHGCKWAEVSRVSRVAVSVTINHRIRL